MKLIVLALVIVACGPRLSEVWPVSPEIARSSSFSFNGGTSFVVDHHHLLTAASLCAGRHDAIVEGHLCLLTSTSDLGNPLILADSTPHGWRKLIHAEPSTGAPVVATWHEQDPWGDPLDWRSGVVGMVLAPGRYAGLAEIRSFLTRHHVDWHDEPDSLGPYNYSGEQGVGPDTCGAPGDLCGR